MRAALLLIFLAGCGGGSRDRGDRVLPGVDPAYARRWEDVQDVIWREWGKATWDEVARGHKLRDDDEITPETAFVLLYLSRNLQQPLGAMVELHKKHKKDLHAVIVELQVPRDQFFVAIAESAPLPPDPYARAYRLYRTRTAGALTEKEYGDLVVLRIAVDYFAFDPEEFFGEIARVKAFESLLTGRLEQANLGGVAADGTKAPVLERPWVEETRSLFERSRKDALGRP